MRLYHGSTVVVKRPDTTHSRKAVDFGPGFYLTPLREQAERWCEKYTSLGKPGVLNEYGFDEALACEKLTIVEFDSYSSEWLECITSCRLGEDSLDGCDIAIGGVANDKVFNTVELFFEGRISAQEALDRLRFEKPNSQYCFKTQQAIDTTLIFSGAKRL